jgi:hypothetical protein
MNHQLQQLLDLGLKAQGLFIVGFRNRYSGMVNKAVKQSWGLQRAISSAHSTDGRSENRARMIYQVIDFICFLTWQS